MKASLPELISSKKTAEILGINEMTLRLWRLQGRSPGFVKIGSRVMYDTEVLLQWINSQRRRSTSDTGSGR